MENRVGLAKDLKASQEPQNDVVLSMRGISKLFPGTKAHLMVLRDGVTIAIHAMDVNTFLARYDGRSTYANVWIGDYRNHKKHENLFGSPYWLHQ